MEHFGERLRYYRKRRQLTQNRLARDVGVAAAYVSQIESALRVPSLKVARRFAGALDVDLSVLLGAEATPPTVDELSDPQKLELLRRIVRSIEFDEARRRVTFDLESYAGVRGVFLAVNDELAVRSYTFGRVRAEDAAKSLRFHPGHEMVYCAAGTIHVLVDGEKRSLAPGATHSFDAWRGHVVWGEEGSVAVSTVTPPLTSSSYEEGPAEWRGDLEGANDRADRAPQVVESEID
jgi:transcriptional regulator with XRE-family HTH domain